MWPCVAQACSARLEAPTAQRGIIELQSSTLPTQKVDTLQRLEHRVDTHIMDFASLMQSQISASKPPPEKKYLKRSEVEAQRQADYEREQRELEQQRLDRLDKKRKREDEEEERKGVREEKKRRLAEQSRKLREEEEEAEQRAKRKRLGLPELPKKLDSAEGSGDGEGLPEEELLAKLHELGEPRFLFGEDHAQRLRRYRKLTTQIAAPTMTKGPIPTTLELVPEAEMKVPAAVPTSPEDRIFLFRQIASYFDMLLTEWSVALARRPKDVKESYTGKQAYNSMLQALDNLRPLFRKLEKGEIEPSILAPIVEIVKAAQERRYVDANDGYLRLSIGKAAWPIGVTMVGIHERSAREKLHESDKNAAHIMSDEVTRKMLQGIKRCLSYAQTRWPPEDLGQLMG